MLVLNKKKILIILLIIFIALFIVTFIKTNKKQEKIVQTISLPATGKTVVLDAGHGIPDERC